MRLQGCPGVVRISINTVQRGEKYRRAGIPGLR
jgi:hypothetical protein